MRMPAIRKFAKRATRSASYGQKLRKTGKRNRCPTYLTNVYKGFTPRYWFVNGPKFATLEKIRWWPDTQEFVGVYKSHAFDTANPSVRWIERFVWAYSNGAFEERKQFGVPHGYRRIA